MDFESIASANSAKRPGPGFAEESRKFPAFPAILTLPPCRVFVHRAPSPRAEASARVYHEPGPMSEGVPFDVCKWDGDAARVEPDELAAEEPLEIRVRGRAVTVTMRTPGH